MSDIDSLEDMLAALESPSQGSRGGGGRPTSTAPARAGGKSSAPPPDDIDAFLNEIDQETRPNNARGNAGAQSRPVSSAQQPVRQQQPQNAQRAPAQSNAGNRAPAQSNAGNRAPAGRANGDGGVSELQAQGYEMHNNKGKWYSPPKTNKASDFRINGTTSTRVGFVHAITLRSLDDYGNAAKIDSPKDFIGINMTHQETGENVQPWIRDNGDCTYNCAFYAGQSGTVRMEIKLCGNPMFDINVQIENDGDSLWVAKPLLPARPKQLFVVNIVTADGSRPEGVAPFEVQTMGDAEQLRLVNNGDGTYKFQCIPQVDGHLTVQISLHGQPIRDSPVTVKVGDGKTAMKVKQESGAVEVISDTRNRNQSMGGGGGQVYDAEPYEENYDDPPPENYGDDNYDNDNYNDNNNNNNNTNTYDTYDNNAEDVSNDDLAALLDELGG